MVIVSRALLSLSVVVFTSSCAPQPAERGEVVLAINSVPVDVACIRVSASGPDRAVSRELDVMAGAALNEPFSGLPLGTVVFTAEAFSAACESVTKATVPAWISDPAPTAVVLGRIASVALTLHRNGRAKVGIDFSDEPACSPPAAACLTSAECCSRACGRGVCQPVDGGPPDAP
jgi:hypothetical protein